ncbi:hypothetical protein B0T26DRAFT_714435 [Lasiosphaeria miniovina]|uniref:Protein kinase domain-containing protein n=1 Tax=Lasiosphaeria miniovina TaxID=1954250 RepID=A0AA40AB42_9PEZI|nr:uncharacterized protein B0T26DRAFT_714435 [Lasiosphaeria miniovina]KAK0712480.1 hypothetical protein B0T26DRAFT_714435 [Lasiosphaeria miniovina]
MSGLRSAVAFLHGVVGVAHNDINPQNVMLGPTASRCSSTLTRVCLSTPPWALQAAPWAGWATATTPYPRVSSLVFLHIYLPCSSQLLPNIGWGGLPWCRHTGLPCRRTGSIKA